MTQQAEADQAFSDSAARSAENPRARRAWLPRNATFFLLNVVFLLILFAVLRVALIAVTRDPAETTWRQALPSFLVGIRFDFATACYLMIPVMVICYVPWTAPTRGKWTRRISLWSFTLVIAVAVFLLIAETQFFKEFQSRFNQIAVRYFDHPGIVLGMVWYNYPVIRYVAGWLVVAAAIHFVLRGIFRISFGPAGRAASEETPKRTPSRRERVREWVAAVLIFSTIAVGARGGFQGEPLAWGDAFVGNNDFVNQMGLNGLWCLGQAVRESTGRGAHAATWSGGHLPIDEAREIARSMILSPKEKLIDPSHRTILRKGDNGSSIHLATPSGRPLNVVVVMMESFSARYCGATGAPTSFTPAFDALAKDGVLFDRCLSAGSHTHQGIFATLLGFPNLPGYETLMSSGVANQHFLSLPEIFQRRNYHTFFLYNGDFSWDNMRGFFTKQGVDTFVGGDDMTEAKYRDHVWGVSDGDLFDRCNREFEAADKNGPFFAAVMTLSNHAPFEVPPVPGAEPITTEGEFNKRLEAQRYADWAVGHFIEGAKKLSYFNNTLFVFVGDHGYHVPPQLTEVHLLYHHVPLLFYAPNLLSRRGVDHRVASHVNIVPSVLGLLGLSDTSHASWGRSLFNDSYPDENFAVFKMSGGGRAVALARGNDLLILGSASGRPLLMNFSLWPPTINPIEGPQSPALEKKMERELRGYVQAGLTDLTGQKAGPTESDRK